MYICVNCRFEVELDDVVMLTSTGGCVCLHCFERETETAKPMPKKLRQQVIATLAEPEVRASF